MGKGNRRKRSSSGVRGSHGGEATGPAIDDSAKFGDGGLQPSDDEVEKFHSSRVAGAKQKRAQGTLPEYPGADVSSDDDVMPLRRGEREVFALKGDSHSEGSDSDDDTGSSSAFDSDADEDSAYEVDPRVQAAAMAYDDELSGSDVEALRRASRGEGADEDLLNDSEVSQFRRWGRRKQSYYDADFVDDELMSSGGEEAALAADEEAEAARVQRERAARLADADYEYDDDSDEDAGPTLGDLARSGVAKSNPFGSNGLDDVSSDEAIEDGVGMPRVERIARDVASLSTEEKLEIVATQSPELLDLLDEFKRHITEVRTRIEPIRALVAREGTGKVTTARGMSFLEAKYHLLLSYCQCIAFFVVLKVRGESTKDHPVIDQLVRFRTILERMRPLEAKLKYQIDRLVERANSSVSGTGEHAHRANLAELVRTAAGSKSNGSHGSKAKKAKARANAAASSSESESSESAQDGDLQESDVYRPPKVHKVRYDGEDADSARVDGGDALSRRQQREEERIRRRATQSQMMRYIREEFGDAPVERRQVGAFDAVSEDADKAGQAALELDRQHYEEDNFIRLQLSKEDRQRTKRLRQERRKTDDDLTRLDAFAEIADFRISGDGGSSRTRATQAERQAEALLSSAAAKRQRDQVQTIRGLLDDIGTRDSRSAEYDPSAARRQEAIRAGDKGSRRKRRPAPEFGTFDDERSGDASHLHGEEHEFYREALAQQATKRRRQEQVREASLASRVPTPHDAADAADLSGHRAIRHDMQKNRGLTRQRSKKVKTPHLKARHKYDQALSRRRGAVPAMRDAPGSSSGYTGETTGVNISSRRSRTLG